MIIILWQSTLMHNLYAWVGRYFYIVTHKSQLTDDRDLRKTEFVINRNYIMELYFIPYYNNVIVE